MSHPLLDMIAKGHDASVAKRLADAVPKLGHLRGGDAGAIVGTEAYGKCGRLSMMRADGVEFPVDNDTREQFAGGFKNEDIVAEWLLAGDPSLPLKRESDWPTEWATDNGTPVSGRPDIVLMNEAGTAATTLIELKSVVSMWSALSKHYDLKPDSGNIIQAAQYSMALGKIPMWLLYSNRSQFHLSTAPKWLQAKFLPGPVYNVEYKDDGTPLKIGAFNRVYDLTWGADGHVYYHTEGLDRPVKTEVTEAAIRAYYNSVAEHRAAGTLPARPSTKAIDGTKGFLACDYCEAKDVCDNYEGQPAEWRDRFKLKVKELEDEYKH